MRAQVAKPLSRATRVWLDWWHATPVPEFGRRDQWAETEALYREKFAAFSRDKRRRRKVAA